MPQQEIFISILFVLTFKDISISADLKEVPREQAILLDLATTNELIEYIRSGYPEMANGLQQLADRSRFE